MRINIGQEFPNVLKTQTSSFFSLRLRIIAAGAFAAYAQDTTTPVAASFRQDGTAWHDGQVLIMMWDEGQRTRCSPHLPKRLASMRKRSPAELQSGKTLAQLAQEKGIDLAAVTDSRQATMKQHLDALVAAGVLTQAQADARLSLMQEHWDEMPMFNGTGYGMIDGHGSRRHVGQQRQRTAWHDGTRRLRSNAQCSDERIAAVATVRFSFRC